MFKKLHERKEKQMKKIITLLMSFIMICSNIMIASASDFSSEHFNPVQKEMYKKYQELLEQNFYSCQTNSSAYGNFYETIKNDKSILIEPNETRNIENFKDILVVSNGNSLKEVILEENNEVGCAIITVDIQNDAFIYYEWEDEYAPILIIVNGTKYLLEKELATVSLVSENNDKLVISKTYYENELDNIDSTNNSKLRATRPLREYPYSLSNDSKYSTDVGPLKATNKDIFRVLDAIALTTGGIALNGLHPILGAISFVCAAASYAGNHWNGTFYIRYWRAYELNTVYGLTRSKERWFSESSCEDKYHVKNYTSYFNSTRPPY